MSVFPRTWRLAGPALILGLTGCGLTLTPPGFVREHRHGVSRAWFDCNSRRRPSFTFESYDHLPPDSARVKLFRWSQGGSVEGYTAVPVMVESAPVFGDPTIEPAPESLPHMPPPAPAGENDSQETTPEVTPPPPAPPSAPDESPLPELDSPFQAIDDAVIAGAEEEAPPSVHVTLGFSEEGESDSKELIPECSLPGLIPPPPSP